MTQEQATAGAVLDSLGFKLIQATPGADLKYEVTTDVIDALTAQKGKSVAIGSDGSVRIE